MGNLLGQYKLLNRLKKENMNGSITWKKWKCGQTSNSLFPPLTSLPSPTATHTSPSEHTRLSFSGEFYQTVRIRLKFLTCDTTDILSRKFFVMGSSCDSLDVNRTSPSSYDNQKYIQTLSSVPWEAELPVKGNLFIQIIPEYIEKIGNYWTNYTWPIY